MSDILSLMIAVVPFVLYFLYYALNNKECLAVLTMTFFVLLVNSLHLASIPWSVGLAIVVTGYFERRKALKQAERDMRYASIGNHGSSWTGTSASWQDDSSLEDDFALAEMLVAPSSRRTSPLIDITIPDAPERRTSSAADEHHDAVNDALFKRYHANRALHYNPNSYDAQRKDAIARQAEQKARRS